MPHNSDEFDNYMSSNWDSDATEPLLNLTPPKQFALRRKTLADHFGEKTLVIPAGQVKAKSQSVEYTFRASSEFIYLTGFSSPNAVLVINQNHHCIYMPEPLSKKVKGSYRDASFGEFWVGPIPSLEVFGKTYEIETKPINQLASIAETAKADEIVIVTGVDLDVDELFKIDGGKPSNCVAEQISTMRLVKDEYEIEELKLAASLTHEGFNESISELPQITDKPYGEKHVAETFSRYAKSRGNDEGYSSIVAANWHSTILHWTGNGPISNDNLLLMDMGVETKGFYTADVTRTIPVNGKFASLERDIYEIVLAAHDAAFDAALPGNPFSQLHLAASKVLFDGLKQLGVIKPIGPNNEDDFDLQYGKHRRYFPHGVSHSLGMDVHDSPALKGPGYREMELQPGWVITIEPGLYFQKDDLLAPEPFRGLGIRIENDVLITQTGAVNLTEDIPYRTKDVENWITQLTQV